MSTIRPDLPAVRPVSASPAGSAQAAFFKTALAQVQAAQGQAQQPQTRETSAPPSASAEPQRMARPGSLLDIRV